MKRYYILTSKPGLGIIEADSVDEGDSSHVRFIAESKVETFSRDELLWYSPVELAAGDSGGLSDNSPPRGADRSWTDPFFPDPFASFGHAHDPFRDHRSRDHHRLPSPWEQDTYKLVSARQDPKFFRRSEASHQSLQGLMFARMPPEWKKAVLELKVRFDPVARRYQITHRIHNPDTGEAALDFSDELFAAIEVFHRIDAEVGQNWDRSKITLSVNESGQCSVEMNFFYDGDFGLR